MLYKILWSGFGFLSGVFLCVIFLLKAGSFPGFLEVAKNYLPLYLNLIDVGPGRVIMASWHAPGINDIFNIIFSPGFETIPLIISCFFVFILRDLEKIKMAFLVFLLVISYRIYAYIGMKDFDYYYIPARYFVFVGVSMAAVLLPLNANRLLKSAHILWLCVIFYSVFNSGIASGYRGDISNAARVNAKNDLEAYLNKNIRPGDGVQPKVQGTHGPIFPAMLSAELPMAISRFPLSQAFYHHVHDPYVSSLQVEYMRYLKKNPPRFILDDNGFAVYEELSNERPFPEYEDFLEANYRKVYDNLDRASAPDQFIVFEIKP